MLFLLAIYFCPRSFGLYKNVTEIETVDTSSRLDQLLQSDKIYVIQFYAPWCRVSRGFSSDFVQIAKTLKNDFTFLAVKDEDLINRYKVTNFPSIQMFFTKDQAGKVHVEKFNGDYKIKDVVSFIFESLKNYRLKELNIDVTAEKSKSSYKSNSKSKNNGKVIVLTDNNIDKHVYKNDENFWMIFFYAPWCGHSKPIHPVFDKLAQKVADMKNVKIAKLDATTEKVSAQRYGITHFPTFRYYLQGKKDASNSIEFKEGRDVDDFYQFILKHYKEKKDLTQIVSQEQFDELCEKAVCLLALLPSLQDVSEKEFYSYIDILKKVLDNISNLPVTVLWVVATDQLNLIQKLNLNFGFPSVIAIKLSKNVYSILKGNFSEQSIKNFIIEMMTGKAMIENLVPFTINKTEKMKLQEKRKENSNEEL